jgi:hypothetical protein
MKIACVGLITASIVQAAPQGSGLAVGAAPAVLQPAQPVARLLIDPPLAEPLAAGNVVIQFRVENLQLVPVFGPAALAVSPRIGHLHVAVDDAPWAWAHTSEQAIIIKGLLPGRHKVVIDLVNADHRPLAQQIVTVDVPRSRPNSGTGEARRKPGSTEQSTPEPEQPAARIIVDPPLPDRLARGLVFIRYRAENLQIVPVFGPAALGVSPRIGHIHVTVDDAPWQWADAGGAAVIINGLPPGPHKILIELANTVHQPLDRAVVEFVIPEKETTSGTLHAESK